MKIKETVKSVEYNGVSRVATVEQTISRTNDCEYIGNLYFRMADAYRVIDNQERTDAEKTQARTNLANLQAELEEYLVYLSGYTDSEEV